MGAESSSGVGACGTNCHPLVHGKGMAKLGSSKGRSEGRHWEREGYGTGPSIGVLPIQQAGRPTRGRIVGSECMSVRMSVRQSVRHHVLQPASPGAVAAGCAEVRRRRAGRAR
jgi:hypothetical protein